MHTNPQFAFAAYPECTLISRAQPGRTPNVNDAYDPSCSIMHMVLPPSADLYAQVNICLHAWFNICCYSIPICFTRLLASTLTRLFTQLRVDTNVLNPDYLRMYIHNPAN